MLKWTKQGQFKGNQGSRSDSGEYDSVFTTSTIQDTKEGSRHCSLSADVIDSIQLWNGEFQSQACTGEYSQILEDHQHLRRQARNKELRTLSDCSSVHCGLTSCFLLSRRSAPAPQTRSKASETSIDHSTLSNLKTPLSNKTYKTPFSERITDNRRRAIIVTASESDIIVQRPRSLSVPRKMASALPDITGSTILGPEVAWDEDNLSLSQLVDKDCFPCICCYEENVQEVDGHWDKLAPGLKIYSRQPVLMHTSVSQKQARARTIFKDPSGTYYEVGQTMIIPGDYQGWFELVPSDFTRASCFLSIAEIAKVMPQKFFTRSNVKAIRMEGEGESQKFLERKIPAGSVLDVKGTFTAKWKTTAETGLLKKKKKEWEFQEVTYLKCSDHEQCELLIPLTHRGKFNAIYEKGQLTQNAVYSIKDILSDLSLPVKVRLLFGKAPVVPCIFTGMLIIRSAHVMDSVVGSTILNTRNVLFEMPVFSPVKVKYVSDDQVFREMTTYKDAQKLCKKYAQVFSSMIKLAPDMDTGQKVILHVPTDPSLMRQIDESLRALDLITDISLTSEPKDHLLDTGSMDSGDQVVIPPSGNLTEITEYKGRESHTFV